MWDVVEIVSRWIEMRTDGRIGHQSIHFSMLELGGMEGYRCGAKGWVRVKGRRTMRVE